MLPFLYILLASAFAEEAKSSSQKKAKEDKELNYNRLDANIGGLVMYSNGYKNVLAGGMNFNMEGGLGIISKGNFPTSFFFHSRLDVDVLASQKFDSGNVGFGSSARLDLHAGSQFVGFLPVNFAIKDSRYEVLGSVLSSRALYSIGTVLHKEYFGLYDTDVLANISIHLGSRVRDEFSVSPVAILGDFRYMSEPYTAQAFVLKTLGASGSEELSFGILGGLNNIFEGGTQLGVRLRYELLSDTQLGFDAQNITAMIWFGTNPQFDF